MNTIIFVSCLAAISFSSCSDWLDVRPADEIKEEYLFETGNGYRTALNGIYRKLATFDLYGSNLSWGLIDGWGQVYDLDKAPDSGRNYRSFCIRTLNLLLQQMLCGAQRGIS